MVLGWLKSGSSSKATSVPEKKTPQDEEKELEHALRAVIYIMADDVDAADKHLHEENSSFHMLGRGVTQFMRSVMGFEQDIMKEAANRLLEAENKSWREMKRAQKEGTAGKEGRLYSPGMEYALCYAESQLMSAVVAVLNESLTESIKGFYKLRKAYVQLDTILQEEQAFTKKSYGTQPEPMPERPMWRRRSMPGSFDENEFDENELDSQPPSRNTSDANLVDNTKQSQAANKIASPEDSDAEFVDAVSKAPSGTNTPSNYLGPTTSNEDFEERMDKLVIAEQARKTEEKDETSTIKPLKSTIPSLDGPDEAFFKNPIDLFIHSGANLCYGLLLLILSMVPPAFSKLLYIIGFKGDRSRGIKLLWQATKFDNINGAVAGLVLLGYYNGLLGFCDIILTEKEAADDDNTAFPKAKCDGLIETMKARYPKSRLWRLEEARQEAGNRNLEGAIEILNSNQDSIMKQVLALNMFERSLCAMGVHDYRLTHESFLNCTELNSWSHSLYVFAAGAAEVELYRRSRTTDPETATNHKAEAEKLFRRAPGLAGKKKFMARQLPFDVYVSRKVQKWEERAKEWKLDLVDCIGVSPLEEMIYLWNGYKRMPMVELERSQHNLEWSHATHPDKFMSDMDEMGLRSLLKSCVLRNLGKFDEARELLVTDIMCHDRYAQSILPPDPRDQTSRNLPRAPSIRRQQLTKSPGTCSKATSKTTGTAHPPTTRWQPSAGRKKTYQVLTRNRR